MRRNPQMSCGSRGVRPRSPCGRYEVRGTMVHKGQLGAWDEVVEHGQERCHKRKVPKGLSGDTGWGQGLSYGCGWPDGEATPPL